MLGLDKLEKSFGDRTLFSGVSMQLDAGRRYGLVGANGSGKTTLMRVLCGDEAATGGAVTLAKNARMGVLRQDRFLDDDQRILDLAMMCDQSVWAALEEQRELTEQSSPDPARVAELEELVRLKDGYTLEARASGILEGLGIATESHERALRTLSGGFKLRVLLAQVLVGRPELLMLDEPTNHLDILTIRWLEKFLADFAGCAVVISHDHRFLENVATHILDIDYETVTLYPGGYAAFEEQKRATRERKEVEIARAEQTVAEKKAFVERFRAKATKARQAQSRLKQIDKIEIEKLPETSRRTPKFRFELERNSGREVLLIDGLSKSYGDNEVLTDLSLTVRRGERVAVIGANGLGKSTLLKIMVDRLDSDQGNLTWGYETRVGYFPQDHRELLGESSQSALDSLWDTCPSEPVAKVRGRLGMVLFTGDDVHKPISALSGGEAARLIMARLMMQHPNVLVLDEPTNHLDLEAIGALLSALEAYEGTLLFVSHDRWFVSRLATRIVELTPTPRAKMAPTAPRAGKPRSDEEIG